MIGSYVRNSIQVYVPPNDLVGNARVQLRQTGSSGLPTLTGRHSSSVVAPFRSVDVLVQEHRFFHAEQGPPGGSSGLSTADNTTRHRARLQHVACHRQARVQRSPLLAVDRPGSKHRRLPDRVPTAAILEFTAQLCLVPHHRHCPMPRETVRTFLQLPFDGGH
jgi:hypothetical protein